MTNIQAKLRCSLFQKYFLFLFAAAIAPLLVAGASEGWFGYRDQRSRLSDLLGAEARLAAAKIENLIDGMKDQLTPLVQLPWTEAPDDQHRIGDAIRLLRDAPAVLSITLLDRAGKERLHLSRVGLNRIESGADRSGDVAVVAARSARVWFGPVAFHGGSDASMTIAVAGDRAAAGVAMAEISLHLIWDLVSATRVGKTGQALILDAPGRLIAHPDRRIVLSSVDQLAAEPLRNLRKTIRETGGKAAKGPDAFGRAVIAAMAQIPGVDWTVLVKQPVVEALEPIYAALWRTGALLLCGAAFAGTLAYWLAGRMTGPIRLLEDGTERIGAGQFNHRIHIATGDELERLAARFNQMAAELAISQERSERINRLKRFLAPQVAELVDCGGEESALESHRVEVVAVFCDLRGFTAFSARAEPEAVMAVLHDYCEALGAIVAHYGATLTNFSGDGMMVLVNAPVKCPEPALRAIEMAVEMQTTAQALISSWRARGYSLGFGVGLAMGPATVGRIGSESRLDYTAVGNTVNLASRLCSCAQDGQILVDPIAAEAIGSCLPLIALGPRSLKGYEGPIEVFAVNERTIVTPIQAQSQHDYIIIPRFSPDPRDKRSEPRLSELAAA